MSHFNIAVIPVKKIIANQGFLFGYAGDKGHGLNNAQLYMPKLWFEIKSGFNLKHPIPILGEQYSRMGFKKLPEHLAVML